MGICNAANKSESVVALQPLLDDCDEKKMPQQTAIPKILEEVKQAITGKYINIAIYTAYMSRYRVHPHGIITIKNNPYHIKFDGPARYTLTEAESLNVFNDPLLNKITTDSKQNRRFGQLENDTYKIYWSVTYDAIFPFYKLHSKANNDKSGPYSYYHKIYPYFVKEVKLIPTIIEYTVDLKNVDPNSKPYDRKIATYDMYLILETNAKITDRLLCKWIFIRNKIWSQLPTDLMNLIITYLQHQNDINRWPKPCINTSFAAFGIHCDVLPFQSWEFSDATEYVVGSEYRKL